MKPGKRDRKHAILITGAELDELQRHTGMMAESFGLDRRIERYQGKRPLGLYRWDLECLIAAMESALADPKEYGSLGIAVILGTSGGHLRRTDGSLRGQ